MVIRRITIFVNHLVDGGAARVAVVLAGHWQAMGREVTILTGDDGHGAPLYDLPEGVVHRPLDLQADSAHVLDGIVHNVRRLSRIRAFLREERPDVLVSFLDRNNVLCLLATRGLGRLPVIVSERTDPGARSVGRSWNWLRRRTYPWAQAVVAQTSHAAAFFRPPIHARVIPNAVVPPPAAGPSGERGRFRLMTAGRLTHVKGHDLLLEAFARVAPTRPDWDLVIYGDGADGPDLHRRIEALGLAGRAFLPGATPRIYDRLREADVFVLSSRAEGFPNALAEAMACGLPVISFDCHSGPSELIRQDVDGLLVPPGDVAGLAEAMGRLMDDPAARLRMGAAAREVLERYSEKRVLALWEDVLQAAVRASRPHQGAP